MTGPSRIVASVVAIVLLGGAAAFAIVWRPAIAAVEPPGPQAFDATLVKRGRDLSFSEIRVEDPNGTLVAIGTLVYRIVP